jgi:hypothetical protein
MDDLVKQARSDADSIASVARMIDGRHPADYAAYAMQMTDAKKLRAYADRIEADANRIKALEEALKPFAGLGAKLNSRKLSDGTFVDGNFTVYAPAGWPELTLNSDHLRCAAAALENVS